MICLIQRGKEKKNHIATTTTTKKKTSQETTAIKCRRHMMLSTNKLQCKSNNYIARIDLIVKSLNIIFTFLNKFSGLFLIIIS